jgi:hypothetical protein
MSGEVVADDGGEGFGESGAFFSPTPLMREKSAGVWG